MAGICSSTAPGTVLGVGVILPSAGHGAGMMFALSSCEAAIGHQGGSGIASVTMSKTWATQPSNSPARPCSLTTLSGA